MKKMNTQLAALALLFSVATAQAQWSAAYNAPAINGTPSNDVAYDAEMESNGTTYVAGVINGDLSTQDVRLMKYSATGVQLGTFTHSTPAHKETVRFMVTGTDNNLYVVTSADEVGNNLNYIKVMKYSKAMQFLSAMTYSSPTYYVPTAAAVDAAGALFISCTKKNPMGGTGELAVLKIGQNLMIQNVFTYSYMFPGDGYHVVTESMFVEAGAVYVSGHIIQGGAFSARTLLIKVNSTNMTSQFIKIGSLNANRNSFASIYVTDKYVYVAGTTFGATATTQRFHKYTGLLEATYNNVNLAGQTNEGRKISVIGGSCYQVTTVMIGGASDLKLYKIDPSTLQPLSTSTQNIAYPVTFNDILITPDMVLATGGAIVGGNWKMYMSTLKVGGLSTFELNTAQKSTGMALTKRLGGFVATGWQDKAIAPALPDNQFFTQYIPDAGIYRIQGEEEQESFKQLRVYPNPALDQINVKGLLSNSYLKVTDLYGKLIAMVAADDTGQVQLNIGNWKAGVYMIESEGSRARFLKQ